MFENLSDRLQGIVKKLKGQTRITEKELNECLREVKLALLEADVNYKVVKKFVNNVKEKALGEDVMKSLTPGQQVVKIVRDELTELLGSSESKLNISSNPPTIIMLVGLQGSGKTTLTNIVAGLYTEYEGGVSINQFSLRDLDITHLRDKVAKNISKEDIFDGTIYENITVGKNNTTVEDVIDALEKVGLRENINAMPDGMHTHILSGGKGLPSSMIRGATRL